MNLRIAIESSEDGGFTVWVPALPGCLSEGETREEAIRNIREAIDLFRDANEDSVPAAFPARATRASR